MAGYKIQKFPKTRIATIDVCTIGLQKHHIAAMLEFDITQSREKIRKYKREIGRISFTSWLIKAISITLKNHELAASYLQGKRKALIFNDINVSVVVEKKLNGQNVPIPLVIEKANERAIESITRQIDDAKDEVLTDKDIVLQRKSDKLESIYYLLPGYIRRFFWRYMLKHPHFAYQKMGNVAVTSIGMVGKVNGWFIPISVHPVCFGISSVIKSPVVTGNNIEIREMLRMTILLDHDVIDGGLMTRFISDLTKNIENGIEL